MKKTITIIVVLVVILLIGYLLTRKQPKVEVPTIHTTQIESKATTTLPQTVPSEDKG